MNILELIQNNSKINVSTREAFDKELEIRKLDVHTACALMTNFTHEVLPAKEVLGQMERSGYLSKAQKVAFILFFKQYDIYETAYNGRRNQD